MCTRLKGLIIYGLCAFLFLSTGYCDESLKPFLLPKDHPIEPILDQIFQDGQKTITNLETLTDAGFRKISGGNKLAPCRKKIEKICVVSHPDLKNYLIKLYTDEQQLEHKIMVFLDRIKRAKKIQEVIKRNGYQHLIKVPKKWIYRLPKTPHTSENTSKFDCCYVLIVEDMQIVNKPQNEQMWKSELVNTELLNAVYTSVKEGGLVDIPIFNLPFSIDSRISIIDTESIASKCRYSKLGKYLSPEMKRYWESLYKQKIVLQGNK